MEGVCVGEPSGDSRTIYRAGSWERPLLSKSRLQSLEVVR